LHSAVGCHLVPYTLFGVKSNSLYKNVDYGNYIHLTVLRNIVVQMGGESGGLNLRTREVNRGRGDGQLASFTVMRKKIKVRHVSFLMILLYHSVVILLVFIMRQHLNNASCTPGAVSLHN